MLVLTRRTGQRINIDGKLTIVVQRIRGGRVKLGFVGPGTKVLRSEVLDGKRSAAKQDQGRAP